jgi:Cft2 family RNA processing exonuclease
MTSANRIQARAVNRARGLLRTARRCAQRGRTAEALLLAETATRIYRRLVRSEPEIYLPSLARALTDVGTLRSYTSWQSAVAPAQEANLIYRELIGVRASVLPELAGSLSNLLTFLWEAAAASHSQTPTARSDATP